MTTILETNPFQIKTVWHQNNKVYLLDQTLLPTEEEIIEVPDVATMWDAIKRLAVRGAPAIGVAAGYGIWIAARNATAQNQDVRQAALQACDHLATSRPTAVNLFWALDRMRHFIQSHPTINGIPLSDKILAEAEAIKNEDLQACHAIGRHGATLISNGDALLTHCNAGALATSGFGTALAPMFWAAQVEGKKISVYANETRPLLQGARLTIWELQKAAIPATLLCDSMAGSVMASGAIQKVIVGADRIAANGDAANKIGTYSVAILARYHNIPFYIAAPWSTIDMTLKSGAEIPIENRHPDEVIKWGNTPTAPPATNVHNPAFDVTPADLITGYITEKGIFDTLAKAALAHNQP